MHNYSQLTNTLYMTPDFTLTNKLLRLIDIKIQKISQFQEELQHDETILNDNYRQGCVNTVIVIKEELESLYNTFIEEHQ